MHITGFVVCVDYSDYFAAGLPNWRSGLDSLVVITTPQDTRTENLSTLYDCCVHKTLCFYDQGAKFNKGAAIAEAFSSYEASCELDWVLLFDADMIPPKNWRSVVESSDVSPGNLYGSWRYDERGNRIRDGWMAGYFFLSHISDPRMQVRPIVDTCWNNAGVYDSTYMDRWPRKDHRFLDLHLVHQGDVGVNWCGRGNRTEMAALMNERKKRRGSYEQERIK